MTFNFDGQVVLVTGATRGIGRQIAEDFGKLGARLLLTGSDPQQIQHLNRSLSRETRKSVRYLCVDFTNAASTAAFLKQIEHLERIDVCVNNAGINRINLLAASRDKDWDDIMAVNLKAPFLLTRSVSRIMKNNGYGRIVNIASIFGIISREKRSIYSASKSGLLGLTVASSNELARHNVLVNAVSPGFILTDLTKKMLSKSERSDLAARVPVGRLALPAEISPVIVFLASRLNSYLTGQNIIIDGGYVNV